MNTKNFLRQGYRLNMRIQDKQERLASLKEKVGNIGAIDYSKDRVQGGSGTNAPFENQVIEIVDYEEEINRDIRELCKLQIAIGKAIDAVEDVNCSLVLSKRYILMKDWEQIAEEMNYSKKHIHRLHKKGLELIVIPEL